MKTQEKSQKNLNSGLTNRKWDVYCETSSLRETEMMCGGVAQLVEHRTENPCVTGSIPVLATIFFALTAKKTRSRKASLHAATAALHSKAVRLFLTS